MGPQPPHEVPQPEFQWKTSPTEKWKVGDKWFLSVELWGTEEANTPLQRDRLARYRVLAEVTNSLTVGGHECWEVRFLPTESAPDNVRSDIFSVAVDKRTGQIQAVIDLNRKAGDPDAPHQELAPDFKGTRFPEKTQTEYPLYLLTKGINAPPLAA